MSKYWQKFAELERLEHNFIPIHRTIKDNSYPSVAWALLEHDLELARTLEPFQCGQTLCPCKN